jgi:hypothetical protein
LTTNIPGYEGTYKTFELAANKRFSRRWSMNASFSYTWTHEFGNNYANNRFGTAISNFSFFGSFPSNPNEVTENEFTNWLVKFSGTIDAGWDIFVTPALALSSGAPYGRYFSVAGCSATVLTNCSNYGQQLVLVEPLGTRRQENVAILNTRIEKRIAFAARGRVALFLDIYNMLNANTLVNINWRSGASFEKATTVVGPRIFKFGMKFDW